MTWTCSSCTLINENTSICAVCGNSNQDSMEPSIPLQHVPSLPLFSPCASCKKTIWPGTTYARALENFYHVSCFCCVACAKELPAGIPFQVHQNEPYHPQCYQELFHPRCEVCNQHLPMTSDGRIMYSEVPFWGQKYCSSHEHQKRCCSCRRMEPENEANRFNSLSDGRKLCSECINTVILDTEEVLPVVQDVWAFLASLGMHLPELPVFLVDFATLNAQNHENHSHNPHETTTPIVYGVCLSEVVHFNHFVHRSIQKLFRLEKSPTRRVNGIMVLHGLPYDMTAYILAHEATHAYFKLHEGFPTSLPPRVEEGMCQLMGYLYLQYRKVTLPHDDNQYDCRLRDYYLHALIEDASPIYGDGLRDALHAFNKHNSLQTMLDHIRVTSSFPE